MKTIQIVMKKVIFIGMFITAIITWIWMIFAWLIAIIGR